MKLQDQMINLANLLQRNEIDKAKCKKKLEVEEKMISKKVIQYDLKEKERAMLKRKTKIIGYKVAAMRKYEAYL